MEKVLCAADLTASNADEAKAILGQMSTVENYTLNDGLFTVQYNTDDQGAIELDWMEACSSLEGFSSFKNTSIYQ